MLLFGLWSPFKREAYYLNIFSWGCFFVSLFDKNNHLKIETYTYVKVFSKTLLKH